MAKTARKAEDHTPPIQTGQGATHALLRGGHAEGQDLEAEGMAGHLYQVVKLSIDRSRHEICNEWKFL